MPDQRPPREPRRDRRASALRYEGTGAPKVVATGEGAVADRILEHARAAGVPVREDPALAAALASMSLGREVPEELWMAVAEVLVWAYGLEGRAITPNR